MAGKIFKGFTLIELMIVMVIVSLLLGLVGPLAINSLEKAQAKQEMMSLKQWLQKISYRSYHTGYKHRLKLEGKKLELYAVAENETLISTEHFTSLFFTPQNVVFDKNGFVSLPLLKGTYRGKPLTLELNQWINKQDKVGL